MLITSSPILYIELCSDQEKLIYRGEGNSSLVIALKKQRKVIRLLKCDSKHFVEGGNGSNGLMSSCRDEQHLRLLKCHIDFNEKVMSAFLDRKLFTSPQLVLLNQSQIEKIKQLVRDKRPQYRLEKNVISCEQYALLLPDYCTLPREIQHYFPTIGPKICVEIKPKQGFLPNVNLLTNEVMIKANACRYCLIQFHKLNKGSIPCRSQYCPLDLYSGCPSRMRNAIKALIDNPQNNFRVFRDIQLVYGQQQQQQLDSTNQCNNNCDLYEVIDDFIDCHSFDKIEIFSQLIIQCLRSVVKTRSTMTTNSTSRGQYCSLHLFQSVCCDLCSHQDDETRGVGDECSPLIGHSLPNGCVLHSILCAQKLDTIDTQLANEMFEALVANNEEVIDKLKCHSIPDLSEKQLINESKYDFYFRKVWLYLVSLTAKDCSIMITMKRLLNHNIIDDEEEENDDNVYSIIEEVNTRVRYLVRISVTDLDQKCPQKIRRTFSNDLRCIQTFQLNSNQ